MRGLYKPSTVRCVDTKVQRHHGYTTLDDFELPTGIGLLKCYADLQVNDYIVGSGPLTIPVVVLFIRYWDRDATAEQIAALRADAERVLIEGGEHRFIREHGFIRDVPEGGITNVESIIFLGPEMDASVEGWEVFTTWNMERKEDGTVMVIHPHAFWWQDAPNVITEWTLGEFTMAAQTAHAARLSDYAGRIGEETDLPLLVTNANNLHAFHVETGNVNHPDGPPETTFPPACGLAVQDYRANPGLMQDCFALLEAVDALRGDGTLNWGVDTTIADWDGVTVAGSPRRVTELDLRNKSLTGSIPAGLGSLARLESLWLSGNSLTGCIPIALRDVATNDLDDLGLPDCAPP